MWAMLARALHLVTETAYALAVLYVSCFLCYSLISLILSRV
jgi:hypothetical protein